MTGTYCTYGDIKDRFEGVRDYLDESGTDAGTAHCNRIIVDVSRLMDSRLGVKYSVPIGTLDDGSYDEILTETCVNGVLYNLTKRRHMGEDEGLPSWVQTFGSIYNDTLNGLSGGTLALQTETTRMELGINSPITGTGNTGRAKFFNNSGLTAYGDVYQGAYEKTFWVKIDGAASGTHNIINSTWKASEDDGMSWFVSGQPCGTDWEYVKEGIYIRWQGTSADALGTTGTLTNSQIAINDLWKFKCIPMREKVEAGEGFVTPTKLEREG